MFRQGGRDRSTSAFERRFQATRARSERKHERVSTISGSYPGGPKKPTLRSKKESERHAVIPGVSDLEQWARRAKVATQRRNRARRIKIGFACALLAAGGLGSYVGLSTHTTPEQLAEEERSKVRVPGELSDQANRLINELWKMEDMERAPRR